MLKKDPVERYLCWNEIISKLENGDIYNEIQGIGNRTLVIENGVQVVNAKLDHTHSVLVNHGEMLKQIQTSVGQIPDLMIQLGANEFDTFMESKKSTLKEKPTTEKTTAEKKEEFTKKIDKFTDCAQELFQCCHDFLDSSRNEKVSTAGKRSWKFLTMKRTEKVYLQLLCGMTLLPLVSA